MQCNTSVKLTFGDVEELLGFLIDRIEDDCEGEEDVHCDEHVDRLLDPWRLKSSGYHFSVMKVVDFLRDWLMIIRRSETYLDGKDNDVSEGGTVN